MVAKKRSPQFPFIPLEKAIQRAETLYRSERTNEMNVAIAVRLMGYSPKASGGIQSIAALKAYGLIEDKGSSDKRTIRITDLARKIILDTREESKERWAQLKYAALMPRAFQEICERYTLQGLPSDENLRHYLIFEKDFNESTVKNFIKVLRNNAGFANLFDSDIIEEPDVEKEEVPMEENHPVDDSPTKFRGFIPPAYQEATSVNQVEIANIRVSRDCAIKLTADGQYSKKSIEALVAQLNLGLELGTYDDPDAEH